MKITKETLSVIKNFATINSNLLIKPGNVLSTINAAKNVLADAVVTEEFPKEFGIYDANEFLGVISLFNDPEIEFKDKFALFKEGNNSVKFYAADASVLTIPLKKITFPSVEVSFVLTAANLATIQKTAAVLRAVDVSVVGKEGSVSIVIGDLKNPSANSFNLDIGVLNNSYATFTANLKIENIKLMAQDYTVDISSKKISRFTNTEGTMTSYIALESSSTF